MTKLDIEKKSYYTTYTTTHGSTGTASGTVGRTPTTRTSDNPDLGTYGEWVETQAGWRFVRREGNLPVPVDSPNQHTKNSCESPTNTSTGTGGTSGQTKGSAGTSTQSSSEIKEAKGAEVGPKDYSFRRNQNLYDTLGPDRLKTLDWLKPDSEGATSDDPGSNSFVSGLFDTNFDAANGAKSDDEERKVIPLVTGKNRTRGIKGFRGELVSEGEFRFRLQQGCFCCGELFSLDNPHDFAQINNIHWWDRERWACDYCYNYSANDWVKKTIDDSWEADEPSSSYVKG